MPKTSASYRAVLRAGTAHSSRCWDWFDSKISAGHRGRRSGGRRLEEWARDGRDRTRPLVWFHASSVGEGLQADGVLQELRLLRPDAPARLYPLQPVRRAIRAPLHGGCGRLPPLRLPAASDRLLDALHPDLLVFSKLDLWPELATRAAARGASVAIVAGTVSQGSGRLRWPARQLLAPGYAPCTAAGAIAEGDGVRLERLGVPRSAIRMLGDPRFDSVEQRVRATDADEPLLRFGRGAPTLVAGSTWPPDDEVLLSAFASVRRSDPRPRLIVVPHEPTAEHLAHLGVDAPRGTGCPHRCDSARPPAPLACSWSTAWECSRRSTGAARSRMWEGASERPACTRCSSRRRGECRSCSDRTGRRATTRCS